MWYVCLRFLNGSLDCFHSYFWGFCLLKKFVIIFFVFVLNILTWIHRFKTFDGRNYIMCLQSQSITPSVIEGNCNRNTEHHFIESEGPRQKDVTPFY